MRIALSSPVRKYTFVAGCVALLSLAWALCWQAIGEHWLEKTTTLENATRAARLQPLNADHEEDLGNILMDPTFGRFQEAAAHYQRAVAIDPHSSRAWLNLANAYGVLGEDDRRLDAVRHAMIAEPKDTQVQWEAANLFLDTDLDRSLQLLRGVVENDPQFAPAAMQVAYEASNNNIEKAMLAIPLTTALRLQLMHWLLDRHQDDALDRVWPTVLSAPGPLHANEAFFYLDSLVGRHQVGSAYDAWLALVQRDPVLRAHLQPDNLVTNGDFEDEILNGGFGWRYAPTAGVTPTLDTTTFHGGTRSLALQVDGDNLQDFGFHELIKVEAGAHYRIGAWLHTEELEGAHGARLSVTDAYSNAELLLTDEVLGSLPWRELDSDFTVPAGTQLVKLSVVRSPSSGRIRGKLWLDDVRIEKR